MALVSGAVDPRSRGHGLNIRQRLFLIVGFVAVPMLLLSAAIVWTLAERERDVTLQALTYSSRSIMSAVDAQLGTYKTVLRALAASPSLRSQDLGAFRQEAERALPDLHDAWVVVADALGQQLLNTRFPAGAPLPPVSTDVEADKARAFATRDIQISNVRYGPTAKAPLVGMGMPIFRASQPDYYLLVVFAPTFFRDLLDREHIPGGWISGIIDRNGNFVAQSRDHASRVGTAAPEGWRAVMRQDGVTEFRSDQGQRMVNANSVSPLSGWAIGVGAEKSVLDAPLWQTVIIASIAGSILILSSILLAAWAARKITVPIHALTLGAEALQRRQPISLAATGVPEVDHVLESFDTAARELSANQLALRQNEERFRLLVAGIQDYAVYMLDPDGRVASWNQGARRLKGWEKEEIIGRHFSIFYPSADVAASELQVALNAGAYEKECEHVRKDGTRFWASSLTTPIFDELGDLKGFSKVTRDISERKQTEEALRSQAALLELAHDAIVVCSPAGQATFWSRGAEQTYGWTADEVQGRDLRELLSTKFPKPPDEINAEVMRTGQWEGELTHTRKDGRDVVVTSRWTMQRDAAGRPAAGILMINRDITDRKEAEQELAILTGRLRATVDTAVDAIVVIDDAGIVQSVNPAGERIFGYQAGEIVGENVTLLMPEPHRSAHRSYMDAYLRTGVAKIIGIDREVDARRKNGELFPVDLAVAEWRTNGKRYFTGIIRDITARRQAEDHVRFLIRELSHRTKNLLAVVQSIAWKTARTSIDLEDFGERFAKRIEALACSHDLLTSSDWHGVRLEDLVRGQLHLFGAEQHLDVHGPDLVLKPSSAQSLGFALHELATNASKYGALRSPEGRIEVGWGIDPDDVSPRRFRMTWRERGGPETSPPRQRGFGHSVIKDMTERSLNGDVVLEFASGGLLWQLTAPANDCMDQ
jgi:PAS domain S-box-containing protein